MTPGTLFLYLDPKDSRVRSRTYDAMGPTRATEFAAHIESRLSVGDDVHLGTVDAQVIRSLKVEPERFAVFGHDGAEWTPAQATAFWADLAVGIQHIDQILKRLGLYR